MPDTTPSNNTRHTSPEHQFAEDAAQDDDIFDAGISVSELIKELETLMLSKIGKSKHWMSCVPTAGGKGALYKEFKLIQDRVTWDSVHAISQHDSRQSGSSSNLSHVIISLRNLHTLLLEFKNRLGERETSRTKQAKALNSLKEALGLWLRETESLWACVQSSPLGEAVASSDLPIAHDHTLENFISWARDYATGRYTRFDFAVQSVHLFRDRRPPLHHEFAVIALGDRGEASWFRVERAARRPAGIFHRRRGLFGPLFAEVTLRETVSFGPSKAWIAGEYADELASLAPTPHAVSEADMLLGEFANHLNIISSTSPSYALWTYNCRWFARRVVMSFAQRLGNVIGLEHYLATWEGHPVPYDELRAALKADPFGGKTLEGTRGAWIQAQTLLKLIEGYIALPISPSIIAQVLALCEEALKFFQAMTITNSVQHAGLSDCWSARSFVLQKMRDHTQSLESARLACQSARDAAQGTHIYDALLVDRLDELALALDFESQYHDALTIRRESLAKRRSLLQGEDSARHHLALARTLQFVAGRLSVQSDDIGALSAMGDAIHAQRLGRANDAVFPVTRDEQLAIYLAEQAQILFRMDRVSEALATISESVIILAGALDYLVGHPPLFGLAEPLKELQQRLAQQLLLQSMYAARIERWDEACVAGHARVTLLRALAETDTDGSQSRKLVVGSNTLIRLLLNAKRPAEAYDVGLATLPVISRVSALGVNSAAFLDIVAETEENLAESLRALKNTVTA